MVWLPGLVTAELMDQSSIIIYGLTIVSCTLSLRICHSAQLPVPFSSQVSPDPEEGIHCEVTQSLGRELGSQALVLSQSVRRRKFVTSSLDSCSQILKKTRRIEN